MEVNSFYLFQPRIFVLLRRCLYDSDDEVSFLFDVSVFVAIHAISEGKKEMALLHLGYV